MAFLKESNPQITKLNENNYFIWKFKMEMLLTKEDLFEVIVDALPASVDDAWKKKDRHARAIMNLHIEDSQIIHVKHETTAKATWEKLCRIHERTNLSSKLYLLRKLYSMKLETGGNMQAHITDMLEIVDKLRGIGEIIKDSHISALLLCSLPESYSTLITALEARPEEELTSEFIKGKLVDEYNRGIEYGNNPILKTTAFKTTYPKVHKRREEKYCTNCHRNNHSRTECWYLKNNEKYTRQDPQYRNRIRTFQRKNGTALYSREHEGRSFEKALTTKKNDLGTGYTKGSQWLIDSGATSHMTNNLAFFSTINMKNVETVTIANGTKLVTKGIDEGYIHVKILKGKIQKVKLENVLYVPELEENLIS